MQKADDTKARVQTVFAALQGNRSSMPRGSHGQEEPGAGLEDHGLAEGDALAADARGESRAAHVREVHTLLQTQSIETATADIRALDQSIPMFNGEITTLTDEIAKL